MALNDDYIDCNNNIITDAQLLAALITKDADDKLALRTMFVDACSDDAIDCTNNSLTVDQLKRKVIGINSCGKPAIRLASPRLAEVENIVTYADDAAAASGGVPVGGLYYKTGVGIHVRMS